MILVHFSKLQQWLQLPLNSQLVNSQCMQLGHIYNVDHSTCSLEYQCYIPIKIVSKFNLELIISNFQNFSGGICCNPLKQGHAYAKCPLHTKKPHKYTLYKVSCMGPPQFSYSFYHALAQSAPPFNFVWFHPCIPCYTVIEVCHRNQPNKSKLALYKPLLHIN